MPKFNYFLTRGAGSTRIVVGGPYQTLGEATAIRKNAAFRYGVIRMPAHQDRPSAEHQEIYVKNPARRRRARRDQHAG